jgi:hypothetical protein
MDTAEARATVDRVLANATTYGVTVLVIPSLILPELATSTIKVTFTNFVGSEGSSQFSLTTLSRFSPFIEIVQNTDLQFYVWQNIQL